MVATPNSSHGTASGSCQPPFRKILVAWDGGPDAAAALRVAARLAGDAGEVVALTVLPSPGMREVPDEAPSWEAQRVAEAFESTRTELAEISPAQVSMHVAAGEHIAQAICAYAAEQQFSLIAVGHGHGGLVRKRLGHVAEATARLSHVPVLLLSSDSWL